MEMPTLAQTGGLPWPAFSGRWPGFFARAYDAGEIGIVAPFDFMRLPVAALLGYLIFAELPDPWSIAGTIVIIASALYLMRRGRIEQRGRRPKGR